MRSGLAAAAALALGLTASAPAQAAVYTWTFHGVVGLGEDETGVFVGPGADLTGLPWTAVVKTDTATPGADLTFTDTYSSITGSLISPVQVAFTLNGITTTIGAGSSGPHGSVYGAQGQIEGPIEVYGYEADEHFVFKAEHDTSYTEDFIRYAQSGWIELGGLGLGLDFLTGHDFRTLPSLTSADAFMYGYVSLNASAYDELADLSVGHEYAWASLLVHSVTPGAVPEPQTWALMILGFGAAGAALRRRYRRGRYATSTLPACCPNEA